MCFRCYLQKVQVYIEKNSIHGETVGPAVGWIGSCVTSIVGCLVEHTVERNTFVGGKEENTVDSGLVSVSDAYTLDSIVA